MNTKDPEKPAPDPELTEINEHLDALLGIEVRKPGSAALLPAVIRIEETLEPAGGKEFPVFPPSYAGEGTNAPPVYDLNGIEYGEPLQEKSARDGTKRVIRYIKRARHCTMDSPQSHANRTEIAFRDDPALRTLVPQAVATIPRKEELTDQASTSVLALPHRVADFRVRASNRSADAEAAIRSFANGNALLLLRLMPTSIVFGFWDSRAEGYQHKHPRILLSRIDAFDVIPCAKHALYTGPYSKDECASVVLKNPDLAAELAKQETASGAATEEEKEKASASAKAWMDAMSARGFTSAPSKGLGGVIASEIKRLSLISLTDIARLYCTKAAGANGPGKADGEQATQQPEAEGETATEEKAPTKPAPVDPDRDLTNAARRYLLALALLAENFPRSTGSYNLRSGCELITAGTKAVVLRGAGSESPAAEALKRLCSDRALLIKVAEAARDILEIPSETAAFQADAATLRADLAKANASEKARKAAEAAVAKSQMAAEAAAEKSRKAADAAAVKAAELAKKAGETGAAKDRTAADKAATKAAELEQKAAEAAAKIAPTGSTGASLSSQFPLPTKRPPRTPKHRINNAPAHHSVPLRRA
ncbi:MAG: type I-U CRISPR-associated RAMP protein Csb1/Cas7u [Verrucomicrobiota bacterium]|nr:type I-U CRISPR-associated RAMP protein Csb1/Cas7u [Verrucomicrobiota bacterium]